jgi:hypothetical protein
MTNYYHLIRKSDDALIGILKNSKDCQPADPCYEVIKTTLTIFRPSFTKIKWTYDDQTENFTNTGQPMTW